jgi:glutaredoxin-like protein
MGLILSQEVEDEVREIFKGLKEPVELIVFTQELECQFCRENRQLAEELTALSPQLKLSVYNFLTEREVALEYWVDMVPAIVVKGEKDYGIKFYGIPGGYEFNSLIETIKMVSLRDSGLSEKTRDALRSIKKPVDIKVFVTLTCPYCPGAVKLAHQFAFESPFIQSAMVEVAEFPHLANKYNVYAVPKTVLNESISFEGALPEDLFLAEVLKTQASGI